MNSYFININNEERSNILDQHKKLYDGYVTEYGNNNQRPLYVQDYANDKNGLTVNNQGNVTEYKNMAINEMRHDGKDTGLFSDEAEKSAKSDIKKHYNKAAKRPFHYEEDPSEDWPKHAIDYDTEFDFELQEDNELDVPPLDGIGDGPTDLKHGTMGGPDDCDMEVKHLNFDDDDDHFDFEIELNPEDFESDVEIFSINESVNKTLDMFRRMR
jgi:hypothetical protein